MKADRVKIDITERTFNFGLKIIELANKLPNNPSGLRISGQIVGSGTSIGANTAESQHSDTKKDFVYKLNIALREARETEYWLKIIKESRLVDCFSDDILNENVEIIKILITIIKKTKENNKLS